MKREIDSQIILFHYFINHPEASPLPVTAVGGRRGRLVLKDGLNLLHNLRSELVNKGQSLEVVLNLLDLGSTENDSANVGVLGGPGEREVGSSGTETLSDLGQLAHLLDLGLALLGLEALDGALEEGLVGGEAGVLGNAVVVLAGEQAAGKRRPDGGAVAVLLEERSVLVLEALAVEGVVLGLLDDGGNQVVLLGEVDGLLDLDGAPLRGTPVVGEVEVADDLGEGLDDLEHGGGGVGTVGEDDIDVGGLEALDGGLETLDDVLAAETAGVGLLATGAEEDLGGQDVLVAGPAELLESLAHLDLGSTVGINLGGVEGLLLEMLSVMGLKESWTLSGRRTMP